MNFKFRGVRGSIAIPGPCTVKYGGNTTCIEVRTESGDLIILDAGTGIHSLGQELLKQLPITAHIFITHTHWDHIQGLPFFAPIFISGNQLKIYGGLDPVSKQGIERALDVQFQHSYFPICEEALNASIEYNTIEVDKPTYIGHAKITPAVLDHPVLNFGYRIDCDGKSLFFTGDFEPQLNNDGQLLLDHKQNQIISAMQGVDALIVDSSFTANEYASKKGWGHGTYESALKLASLAKPKKLFLTHHEPTRTDAQLERIYKKLLLDHPKLDYEIILAREGIDIFL